MKRIGIVAHSAEGGNLCFISACREGQRQLGAHMHPEIVVSAIPMALSMDGWVSGDHEAVAKQLARGVRQVAAAGADFYICPDNTAHIVLEEIADALPIPGLHIAEVVAMAMKKAGWRVAGLLGTKWTMTGTVYERALQSHKLSARPPSTARQDQIDRAIFDELCLGVFRDQTTELFVETIRELRNAGSDCIILGCTEIPLIIGDSNSPLPVLDSTRLLAKQAVLHAVSPQESVTKDGWIQLSACEDLASGAEPSDGGTAGT